MWTRPARPARAARAALALALLAVTACDGLPLRWEPAAPVEDPVAPEARAPDAGLMFALFPDDAPGTPCAASLRLVPVDDSTFVAVWWAVRPDSTAVLLAARGAARRDDAATASARWARTVAVDTLDRGAHGCARPAPATTFEPRTGYVHVSYAMDAPEGTGVFFAHSMDAGRMFHSPVSIVYGPRLAATAIAARGDTVAVAYEDPNSSTPPQVALALSVTAGHIFEHKSIPVSAGAYGAMAPEVAFDPAGTVLARWRERRPHGDVAMLRRATWVR